MSLKKAIFLFVFFSFIIPVSAIQQTPNSSAQAAGSQAGAASAAENARSGPPDGDQSCVRRYYAVTAETSAPA